MNRLVCEKWVELSTQLSELKKVEMVLRKQICEEVLQGKLEGSVTSEQEGMIIKATAKLSRSISNPKSLAECANLLSDDEKSCYTWKPSLILPQYKKFKELFYIREFVSEKPATPALSIEMAEVAPVRTTVPGMEVNLIEDPADYDW